MPTLLLVLTQLTGLLSSAQEGQMLLIHENAQSRHKELMKAPKRFRVYLGTPKPTIC